MTDAPATTEPIMLYGHPSCPMIPTTRALLNQSGAAYEYVNIRQDDEARQRVRTINDGYESVPTLVFPDGSTLTEPSAWALRRKLKSLGYHVPLLALLAGNAWVILIVAAALVSILSAFGVI